MNADEIPNLRGASDFLQPPWTHSLGRSTTHLSTPTRITVDASMEFGIIHPTRPGFHDIVWPTRLAKNVTATTMKHVQPQSTASTLVLRKSQRKVAKSWLEVYRLPSCGPRAAKGHYPHPRRHITVSCMHCVSQGKIHTTCAAHPDSLVFVSMYELCAN